MTQDGRDLSFQPFSRRKAREEGGQTEAKDALIGRSPNGAISIRSQGIDLIAA